MVIVDTSVWVEFLRHREPVSSSLPPLLEERRVLALECVFGELLQGAKNNRETRIIKEYCHSLPKIDEKGLWLAAGEYSGKHNLAAKGVGLIDVFIATAARTHDCRVWTLDKRLQGILRADERFP
jgi:predicted nucleic acid-binding protein